jgi:hypothetical protein
LLSAAFGGAAATFAGFERRPSGLLVPASPNAGRTIDAYEIIQNAIRTRSRLSWGGSTAFAEGEPEVSVITIKVMNQICPPLMFRLGTIDSPTADTTTGPKAFTSTDTGSQGSGARRLADALDLLEARGISKLAPAALGGGRYRTLRFNQWFANILHTGVIEGQAGADVVAAPLDASDTGTVPTSVAIQAVLGVNQSVSASNHDFNNCAITGSTVPTRGGDLAFHVSELG